jgi:hypothetical protein
VYPTGLGENGTPSEGFRSEELDQALRWFFPEEHEEADL